ncbi:MAG TPA: poly(3-hydroxybutyrate) depolymerase, partial [Cyclobacteriaceae bacterium]|nr:poly(3-hydroxybutyrate) depolymerase [Cyclobacteriaceae bacterium]
MKKLTPVILALLSITFLKAQVVTDSIKIDDHYRSFNFNEPVATANASLIFVMHGSGGSGKGMMRSTIKL